MKPRTGSSKCTKCLTSISTQEFIDNDHLCSECRIKHDTNPREFWNLRSFDSLQEDGINEMEKANVRNKRSKEVRSGRHRSGSRRGDRHSSEPGNGR